MLVIMIKWLLQHFCNNDRYFYNFYYNNYYMPTFIEIRFYYINDCMSTLIVIYKKLL